MKKRGNGEWRAFLEEAAYAETDECIEGGGTTRPSILTQDLGPMYASRYVWIIANGDPGELFVLHTCDNHLCVNIRHLYTGTQGRNTQDQYDRNRRPNIHYARGERAGRARLTPEKVLRIRERYGDGESQQRIAEDYGVSQVAISSIVRRKSWTHV